MHRLALLAALAALPGAGRAADPVVRLAAAPDRPGWFACDAVNGPFVGFVGRPGADRTATITMIDRRNGRTVTQDFTVGDADHGAGQVHWSLSQRGRAVGDIHGINPGMVRGSGADALPPIRGITIGRLSLACRWLGTMRFLGIGRTRSVAITQEDGRLVYRSFDYATRGPAIEGDEGVQTDKPALVVNGGTSDGAGDWRFADNGYVIAVIARGGGAPAVVAVTKDGRRVGTTAFLATAQLAGGARLSRADVWSGAGVAACRDRPIDTAMNACLVDAMRRTGATPQAIAFGREQAARVTFAYLSAWRQAGPIGIATITYPFTANTNEQPAIVPSDGAPILVDEWLPSPADEARADWRRLVARYPRSGPFAPGAVTVGAVAPGRPFAVRVRTPWRDCHACAANGAQVVRYDFDGTGRLTGSSLESVG